LTERQERIALNEALFREVNERTKEIAEAMAPGEPPPVLRIFCECGLTDCAARLDVAAGDYERVRGEPEWFIVAVGHVIPDVETVVDELSAYLVVEKHEEEAAIARATDPRS
jgi:hypothetical protein